MDVITYQQALDALDNESGSTMMRERAIQYLREHPDNQAIERLVNALEDDNFGVRWEAYKALLSLGNDALKVLLNALTDPQRVGSNRLRNGAYRILEHTNIPEANHRIRSLLVALKGPAADITTMGEAFKLLQVLRANEKRVS